MVTGAAIEPHFERSIGLIDDPVKGAAGLIWVRVGIPTVGADGEPYEIRNRSARTIASTIVGLSVLLLVLGNILAPS